MTDDECQAMCWLDEYDGDAICCLPPGHDGTHWDAIVGWEW